MNRKVSVIIPNHNYLEFLPSAIESVLNQTYKNLELIVVDNGSTDGSQAFLRTLKGVKLILQENRGQADARNVGVEASDGFYIAFLDADDYWREDKIEKQVELMDWQHEMVVCDFLKIDSNNAVFADSTTQIGNREFSKIHKMQPGASIVPAGESTALLTRNLFNRAGGFDRRLNSTTGWDFFRKCTKLTRFAIIHEPLVYYRVHNRNMSKDVELVLTELRKCYAILFEEDDIELNDALRIAVRIDWICFKTKAKQGELFRGALELLKFKCTSQLLLMRAKKHFQPIR
jgi:glycosyltransferase involved in cell wall biosynthesis